MAKYSMLLKIYLSHSTVSVGHGDNVTLAGDAGLETGH